MAGALWLWRRGNSPRDPRRLALFALPALAVVLLSTAHNVRASGELVLTIADFGQRLYIG